MKLAIVGSTDLTVKQHLTAATLVDIIIYNYLWDGAGGEELEAVVSGGAEGVDTIAEKAAESFGIPAQILRPTHKQWEPSGFKERNEDIAEACDILWAIRSQQSKTYGSGWTADYAEELGKEVYRVFV